MTTTMMAFRIVLIKQQTPTLQGSNRLAAVCNVYALPSATKKLKHTYVQMWHHDVTGTQSATSSNKIARHVAHSAAIVICRRLVRCKRFGRNLQNQC